MRFCIDCALLTKCLPLVILFVLEGFASETSESETDLESTKAVLARRIKRAPGWGKRSFDELETPISSFERYVNADDNEMLDELDEEKRAPGWGKRAPGWGKRAPGWGKRAPGWGKRAPGWGKRAPGWGKRSIDEQSKRAPGWGKRSEIGLSLCDRLEEMLEANSQEATRLRDQQKDCKKRSLIDVSY